MFAAIGGVFMAVLPLLVKLAAFIVDRFSNNEKLKKSTLQYLYSFNKEIPIKIHDRYTDQIKELEDQLRKENGEIL